MKSNLELSYISLTSDTDEKYFEYDVQNWSAQDYSVPAFRLIPNIFFKKDGKQIKMELSPSYSDRYWFLRLRK